VNPAGKVRSAALGLLGFVLLGGAWELVKFVGGGKRFVGMRTDDASMPHLSSVIAAFGHEDVRGSQSTVLSTVLAGSWFSLRLALGGIMVGLLIGLPLAMLLQRFKLVERAWLPYVVLSQTVPLIALAPLIAGWGDQLSIFGHDWPRWMSVIGMAGYLSFFPITIGALRGLNSPKAHSLELMDSYAAGWWQTTTKLRLPSAIPYLIPAMKLAGAASVVGVIVAEISIGLKGGIGRPILEYGQKASGEPQLVFTAFIGAACLGLIVAATVTLVERVLTRNRPKGLAA
jgi:NitT/TauT family transport system permease protein